MKHLSFVLICILLGGGMLDAAATTYYVATSGSNSNSGSITHPWSTISYAVGSSSGVQPGDTILVRAGNYPETVNPSSSGAAGSHIVVKNYPGETVNLNPGRLRIDDGDDYWKFEGLRFLNSNENGLRVTGTHPLGFLTVSNCTFSLHANNGIVLAGADFGGITIEDCIIDSNGTVSEGTGILMYGGVGVLWAHRNFIRNNAKKGISHATATEWEADSSVIDSNVIINSFESGIDWWGDNSYITHNYLSLNGTRDPEAGEWGDKGLALDNHATNNLVANNVVKSSGRWELSPRGENNKFYNNTFIKDHFYDLIPGSPNAADMIFFAGVGASNEFKNNVFVNLVSEEAHQFAIIAEEVSKYTDNIWSHNCYWCAYSDTTIINDKPFKIPGFPLGVCATLSEIQSVYPDEEIGSIWSDPLFVNYEDSVFTLQAGSPCIDAGVDVGLPYVGDAPDMGAFEYVEGNTPPWIYPPVPDMTTDEDEILTFDLTPYEHDLEQPALQLVWSLSGLDPQLARGVIDPATDVLTITPAAEQSGSDDFLLMLTDGQGGQVSQTVTLTVLEANDPPWIDPPFNDFITEEEIEFSYDLTPHEHDLEQSGSELTWSLDGLDPALATGVIDPVTDLLTITPIPDQNGSDEFMLILSDGAGGSDSESVTLTITPVNDPPVINPPVPPGSMQEDIAYNLDLTAFETDIEDSGTALYWTVSGANAQLISATVDPLTDNLNITPVPNAYGSDTLLLTLHDSGGLTDSQNWILTVEAVNDTPWIAPPIPDQLIEGYQPYTLSLLNYGHDIEDPPSSLNWAISGINLNLFSATYNPATKELTFYPVPGALGSDQVVLTVVDTENAGADQTVLIELTGSGAPPVGPEISDLEDFWQPIGFDPQPVNLVEYVTCGTDPFEDLTFTTEVWDPDSSGGGGQPTLIVYVEDSLLIIQAPTPDWDGLNMVAVRVEDTYNLFDADTLEVVYSDVQVGTPIPDPDSTEPWYIVEPDQVVHAESFLVHVADFTISPEFSSFQVLGGQYSTWQDAPGTEAFNFPLIPNIENVLQLRIRYTDNQYGSPKSVTIIEDSTPPASPSGLSLRLEGDEEPPVGAGNE